MAAPIPEWVRIGGACLLPHTGGSIGVFFTRGPQRDKWYKELNKPVWTPPSWVFPPTWFSLYTSMGYASYLVWKECGGFTSEAALPLSLYGTQLALNWAWTPIFFGARRIGLAAIEIVIFGAAVGATTVAFGRVSRLAGGLMIPYLLWSTFAAALNFRIWQLNRDDDEPYRDI